MDKQKSFEALLNKKIVLEPKYRDMIIRASSGAKTGKEYEALTDETKDAVINNLDLLIEGIKREQPNAFISKDEKNAN
jgi:hypothetical protein